MQRVGVHLPVVRRGNSLLMRSRDFWHHRDEVLMELLPKWGIKIIKYGVLGYEIKQPPIVERVTYPFAMPEPEDERVGFYKRGSTNFLRVSELQSREGFVLLEAVKGGITSFTVTWYGWADFTVHVKKGRHKQVRFNALMTHDPSTGIRSSANLEAIK